VSGAAVHNEGPGLGCSRSRDQAEPGGGSWFALLRLRSRLEHGWCGSRRALVKLPFAAGPWRADTHPRRTNRFGGLPLAHVCAAQPTFGPFALL